MEKEGEPISRNRSDWPIRFLFLYPSRSFHLSHFIRSEPIIGLSIAILFRTWEKESTQKNNLCSTINYEKRANCLLWLKFGLFFATEKIESIPFWIGKNKNSTSFFFSKLTLFYTFKYFRYVCVSERVTFFVAFLFLFCSFQTMWCSKEIRVIMDLACTKR